MRILIIPDVHLKYKIVNGILSKLEHTVDKVVFTGDYFDSHGPQDTVEMNRAMAMWLKNSLTKPNRIHLMGNHDMSYRFEDTKCSGYELEKDQAINSVLTKEDWDKVKFFYYDKANNFYFMHGGLSSTSYWNMEKEITPESLQQHIDSAVNDLKTKRNLNLPWQIGIGFSRGGRENAGGITWCDFEREFVPIEGINQIVGHTPNRKVRRIVTKNSVNYCLDTGLNNVAILEGGNLKVLKLKIS